MTFCRVLAFGISVMLASVPAAAQSSAVPEANPGRPTVSAPATLTPLGYVQIEAGVASATMSLSFSSQFGAGATAKLTVHPRVELFTQAEPFVRSRVDGDPSIAPGGIAAGAQVVLLPGTATRPTVSIAYQRTTYGGTAPDGDTGSSRQSALALVSGDVRGFHVDANGIVSDALVAGRRVAQYGEAISVSHAIGRAAIAGEFWRFSQPFLAGHPHTAGTLWALSYALRPNLVVDGGVSRGGSATSTRWQVMTGVTYVVPSRFW